MNSSLALASGMIDKPNVSTLGRAVRDRRRRRPVQIRFGGRGLLAAATAWAILTTGGVAIAQTTNNPNYTRGTSKSKS
jgi:hypothetical protein